MSISTEIETKISDTFTEEIVKKVRETEVFQVGQEAVSTYVFVVETAARLLDFEMPMLYAIELETAALKNLYRVLDDLEFVTHRIHLEVARKRAGWTMALLVAGSNWETVHEEAWSRLNNEIVEKTLFDGFMEAMKTAIGWRLR